MLTIGTFHIPSVLLSVSGWSFLYFMLRWLEPRRKPEWHCRMITVAHALLITILSAWAAFIQGPWPFTNAGEFVNPLLRDC